MIRFVEVVNETDFNPRMERVAIPRYSIGEVWINEKYVVSVREANGYKRMLIDGRLPDGLSPQHEFTAITTNEGNTTKTHVVVGAVNEVATRLDSPTGRQLKFGLLKG